MNMLQKFGGFMLFALTSVAVRAEWYGELGYASGGDKFDITVINQNGSELDKKLSMGGGLNLEIGGHNYYTDKFSLQYGFGHKVDNVVAGSDEVSFRRWPINAIGSYDFGDVFQLGGGLTYELNPKLDLKDVGLGSFTADDAFGVMLQMGWRWGGMRVMIRHTQIDYQFANGKLNGNNTGLHLGFVW